VARGCARPVTPSSRPRSTVAVSATTPSAAASPSFPRREVAQLLFYEDLTQVVLVGTSSGGMVIVKAAELAGTVSAGSSSSMRWHCYGERGRRLVKRPAPNETTDITTFPRPRPRGPRVSRSG